MTVTMTEIAPPRAILRVPEVLVAVASHRSGATLAELAAQLNLPKSSLHRLLHTLVQGQYLLLNAGLFALGPESYRLASSIGQSTSPADFPASARPVLEWLARETGETVTLSVLSDSGNESVYVDVIESEAPLRLTLRIGNRRPLYTVAAGKVMLAFRDDAQQKAYLNQADFIGFTAETSAKEAMPALLAAARNEALVYDRNGMIDGASGIASPAFDAQGAVHCAVSVAGPTDRMDAERARFGALVLQAGERISRILGYAGDYPPGA
jgi:DNA-binding IclR family transcriptional regulator